MLAGLTGPTQFARVQDSSANLWWIWQHGHAVWGADDGESERTAEGVDQG
ncbi:hypothetical protein [Microbacterium sp. LWO12-1.2]